MNKRNYYPINESAESKAAKYRSSIDHAHAIAERIAEARPWQADRVFRIADRYAQKLTDLLNSSNASGQTTEQDAANEAEFQRLKRKYITRLRKILNEKEVIHSDDENVIEELKEKLEELDKKKEHMELVNDYFRKNNTLVGCPYITELEFDLIGIDWQFGRERDVPYPPFEFSKDQRDAERIKKRIETLQKEKRKGNTEQTLTRGTHTITIRENVELMKLQLIFDCKPGSDEQELLRYYHFKWDRANGCWQKTLSDKARKEFKSAKWNFISLGWEEKS